MVSASISRILDEDTEAHTERTGNLPQVTYLERDSIWIQTQVISREPAFTTHFTISLLTLSGMSQKKRLQLFGECIKFSSLLLIKKF